MYRVERPQFRRHRLGRAIQHGGFDLNKFERRDYRQNRLTPNRDFMVGELGTEPEAI